MTEEDKENSKKSDNQHTTKDEKEKRSRHRGGEKFKPITKVSLVL